MTGGIDNPFRCLIVDDESPARSELRYLLEGLEGVQVVGAAATAEEAAVLLEAVDYDVVFLDIRMPGVGGLDLARRLKAAPGGPEVVFTTAYPDHAVDAFELSAADYLLKPFDSERLALALSRVADRRSGAPVALQASSPPGTGADAAGSSETVPPAPPAVVAPSAAGASQRLPVQRGERTMFVEEIDVVAASAARGYCYLALSDERVLVNYTLGELEERLSSRIARVHRSHLVNLDRVAELRSDYNGGLVVVMDDRASTVVPVSRRHGPDLRRRLGI